MFKKLGTAILAAVILLTLFACGRPDVGGSEVEGKQDEDPGEIIAFIPPIKTYILESAADSDKWIRMSAVSLYEDGRAGLAIPPISSLALVDPLYYSVTDDEMRIHSGSETGDVIASFAIVDDNTLVVRMATGGLFANIGARYVYAPIDTVTINIQMGNNGQPIYDLFSYEPVSRSECLFSGRFDDVDSLNTALGEYARDSIKTVHIKHTDEFTEDEIQNIRGTIIIPSNDYRVITAEMEE